MLPTESVNFVIVVALFVLRLGVPAVVTLAIGYWLEKWLRPPADETPDTRRRMRQIGGAQPARNTQPYCWDLLQGEAARDAEGAARRHPDRPCWLAFDMTSGVALSAGGFVMAGTVHIFNVKRFHPIVRPAILTAFLGYLLAIVGLLFDLGRWYNVWHAFFMWNWHSPLLEVAWCVILYTTVLGVEFSPIVFEKFNWQRPLKIVRAIMLSVIIAGLVLSTLHQSTLGTLFLMFPEKLNPLWYSPFLPVFFFMSAVGVGLCMVIVESNLSARFLGQGLESDLLASLGKAAAVVLFFYLALKAYDLIARGATAYLTAPGLHSALYWIEMFFGVLVPLLILATKRGRENPRVLFASSILVVLGVVLNRLNTTVLGWWSYTSGGPIYVPTLGEVIGTVSLVGIGVVAFGLIAKNFPVSERAQPVHAPAE